MRISDWSSDVCSSDLLAPLARWPCHLGNRSCAFGLGCTPRSTVCRCRAPPSQISDLGAAMMSLQEYRTKSASLADFLPWVALVGPGVVLNKDGSFQRTARFRGHDLDSAPPRSEAHTSEIQSL